MKQGYWFKSDLFQIQKHEDEETNPGFYGKELGKWLCHKFKRIGYEVEGVIPENWGWCVMFHHDDYLLWIGCGSMLENDTFENYDPDSPPDAHDVVWHVFPMVEIPFFYFKSWFKKFIGGLDTNKPLEKLDTDLRNILETETRITFCEDP